MLDFKLIKETLTAAIDAVPAVKYALGIAGIAAAAALSLAILGGLAAGISGVVAMVLLMTLLLIFAQAAKNGRIGAGPARVLIWFSLSLVMICTPIGLLSVFSEDVLKARDTICSVTALCSANDDAHIGGDDEFSGNGAGIGNFDVASETVSFQWLALRPDKAKELLQGNGDAVRPLLPKDVTFRVAQDKGTVSALDALGKSPEEIQSVLCLTVLFSSSFKKVSVSGTVLATNLYQNQALLFCVQMARIANFQPILSIVNPAFNGERIEIAFSPVQGAEFSTPVYYYENALTTTEVDGVKCENVPPSPSLGSSFDGKYGNGSI